MTKRNQFSPETKEEIAKLVLDHAYAIKEAGSTIGACDSAVRRWVKQLRAERGGETPKQGNALTEEHRQIQALQKYVKKLELEKDILKKASALLISDNYRNII